MKIILRQNLFFFKGQVIGRFYEAISKQSESLFFSVLWFAGLVIAGSALLESFNSFLVEVLAWIWRQRLVQHLQRIYFADSTFYKLINFDQRIDNP